MQSALKAVFQIKLFQSAHQKKFFQRINNFSLKTIKKELEFFIIPAA